MPSPLPSEREAGPGSASAESDRGGTSAGHPPTDGSRLGVRTRLTVARQRRLWTKRAPLWGRNDSADLHRVVEAVLGFVPCDGGCDVLDIGAGTGQLALPLARRGARVLAVDVSPAMTDALRERAAAAGLVGVAAITAPAESLNLRPGSFDAVVSNYALHHLHHRDKTRLIASAAGWLRPGGRLVIGDMMFGRGGTERDRRIILEKLSALSRKGPGGWWRIAKNAVRFSLRVQERPLSIEAWVRLLEAAGFVEIEVHPVVAEAAVVVGIRPEGTPAAE